ncbi:MAG: ribonuclease P protein component [Caldiserica bacterium]|nr:ribonuclease P protein component [Caldisericota bacterium]
MKLWQRLRGKEFEEAFKSSKKYFGHYIVLFISDSLGNKVGFVTSKKVGGAVQRNRARRIMREAFLKVEPFLPADKSYILVARNSINGKKMQDVLNDFIRMLREEGINIS